MNWILITLFINFVLLIECKSKFIKPPSDDQDSIIDEDERPKWKVVWEGGKRILKKILTGDIYKGRGVKDNSNSTDTPDIKNYNSLGDVDLEEEPYQSKDPTLKGFKQTGNHLGNQDPYQKGYRDGYQDGLRKADHYSERRRERPGLSRRPSYFGGYNENDFDNDNNDEQGQNMAGQVFLRSDTWGDSSYSSEYRNSNGIVVRNGDRKGGGHGWGFHKSSGRSAPTRHWRYRYDY